MDTDSLFNYDIYSNSKKYYDNIIETDMYVELLEVKNIDSIE